jgi:hypothetical protein
VLDLHRSSAAAAAAGDVAGLHGQPCGGQQRERHAPYKLMPTLLYFAELLLLLLLLQVMLLDSKGSRVVGSNIKSMRPSTS